MKRFLTLILSAILVLGAFALVACDGEDIPKGEDAPVVSEYTITFNYGDGLGETLTKKVQHNAAVGELPTPSAEPDHKIFESWKLADGTVVDATTLYTFGTDIMLNAYYVQAYIITFEYGEGSGATLTKKVKDNAAIGALPTPSEVPSGAFFAYWKTEGGATVGKTTVYDIAEDITLIADYATAFTVDLDNSSSQYSTNWRDGTTGIKTVEVNLGETITFPELVWDGYSTATQNSADYSVSGWFYTDKDGVERQLTGETVFSSETLNIEGSHLSVYVKIELQYTPFY